MTIAQQSRTASTPTTTARQPRRQPATVLAARPGGYGDRFAAALGDRHPALVFALALLGGLLALLAVSILLALFVVEVVVSGSGLGLYVSRELCRAMGGDLELDPSEPGRGAAFTVLLPGEPGEDT